MCPLDFTGFFCEEKMFIPAPSQAPRYVTARATNATSILVTWSEYDEKQMSIIAYNVYFSLADTPSDFREVEVPAWEANSAELNDLGIFTLYVARVSAISKGGEGPKSVPVKARTMEGVPSAAPSDVRVVYVDSLSIIVEWGPVPTGSENGVIQGYVVKFGEPDSDMRNKTVSDFTAVLSDSHENTLYTIQVAAYTSVGVGRFSERIITRTKIFDPCHSFPCLNGGICLSDEGLRCACLEGFTGQSCGTYIAELTCNSPVVSLPTLPQTMPRALKVRPATQLLIPSDVQLDCELSHTTMFKWNVYKLSPKREENLLVLSRNGSSQLLIRGRMLSVGSYLVRLTVRMIGTKVFGVSEGYIRVIQSPLIALISGGTKVERGFNKTLEFDASFSRDPDAVSPHTGLNFTWICTHSSENYTSDLLEISSLIPSPSEANLDRGGCYGTGAGKIGSDEPLLKINSGYMVENSSYLITLVVKKDRRQALYTQEVVIVRGDPPEVLISCFDNCDAKLNPSRRLALQKLCGGSSCSRRLSYRWSLFVASNNKQSSEPQWFKVKSLQNKIRTRLTSPRIVTHPGVLKPNRRYKFLLTAKRPGGYPGYSEYEVTSNSPPAGGYCKVSPESGVTLATEFIFKCAKWTDVDVPLQYEFIYFTNNDLNVVYKGYKKSKKTKLPAGDKVNNFTIDFRVRVADMFGAFTEVKTSVQVKEPQLKDESVVDIASNLTTGEDSELTKLIQSGDLSRAVQLAKAAIVAVDDDKKTRPVSQDQFKSKRTEIKSSIVKQLSAVKVETVDRVQQTSDVIAEATSVISEINVEAQKAATDALQTMTTVLKKESLAGESYEALFDGAKSLVSGLGSVLRVSSHGARLYNSTPSEKSADSATLNRQRRSFKEWILSLSRRSKRDIASEQLQAQKESKERAVTILHSLDDVGKTILSRTLVGEEPREISARTVSLLLFREEPDLLAGSVLSSEGSSFTLPSSADLFGNGTQVVDSQMMTTKYTSYSWDPSGARVTTGVSSLELKNSAGHLLNITGLKSPISIKIPNTQDFTNNSHSHYVGANRTVYHKINVTTSGMALVLNVRPENNATEFLVSVKYNERPSPSNSDFNTTVPNFSSCVQASSAYVNCSRDPYVVFVDNGHVNKTGYYFIGIQIKSKAHTAVIRTKRCLGQGRSKRSCVKYKDAPPTDGPQQAKSYHETQYSKGDENYTMQVIPTACLYWSTELSKWTTEGCRVAETTTVDTIHCLCDHLTAFGGQLFIAPNPIDFDKVFNELTRLHETGNVAVIIAVSCVFGLYLLLFVWARKADQKDALKIGEKPFLGALSPWCYRYEIQLSTGIWHNSGTTANVFIILNGEDGSSRPYRLKAGSNIPFARGSITSFTLSLSNYIGPIKSVRVWHDNSGSSPSWFLNTIKILDVSSQGLRTFMCYMWLAVEKGDGLVDRTLTSDATDEKRMKFKVSFQNRIAEEFGDGHLWFSVATRPPRKRFTRVQRLSCCLSLLLTTMLASAMFYEYGPETYTNQGTLKLGRLVLNLRQLIIAVESLLVVIPVNLLIVGIFSHARSPFERQAQLQRRYTVTRPLTIHRVAQNPIKKGCSLTLPHWFTYIAWILCFLSSIASATFVIFYSLQWGKDVSEQWLISIVMSMIMDIFVSEPVKIIVVALLLSHFCKSDFEEVAETPSCVIQFDDIKISRVADQSDSANNNEEEIEIPEPPSKKQLQRARKYRMRELYMYRAIRKIVSYLVYLWIVMIICYGGRSRYSYYLTSSMERTFGQLTRISSQVTLWDWARDVLIPGLYMDNKDVTLSNSTPYIGDGDAVLVGMPRLRQLRVKKDSCEVVEEAKGVFTSCIAHYSFSAEDKTKFYQPRWLPFNASKHASAENLDKVCPKPWRYASAEKTESLVSWGRLQFSLIYSQGGYLAELGYNEKTASKVVSELSQFNWFDKYTSVVMVEFTVFNSRVSLFSSVWIPVEFSPSGHVVSSHVIRTMHVYNLGAGYSAVLIVCQVLLLLFIVYFLYKEVKEMIQKRKHYFSQFLNYIELAQILAAINFIIIHILKEIELFANTAKLHDNIFQFISFDREVLLDDVETALLALLMFFNTFKLLYLFRFNSHVKHLSDVMKTSTLELINCSLGFFVFMFAFTHFGFLQFGREIGDYSTPISALQSLLIQGVVNERVKHLQDCHAILGPLYFITFNMCLHFIWINIFIAILIYDYRTAKRVTKGRYSLGSFMMKKLNEILNCLGDESEGAKKKERTAGKKRVSWKLNSNKRNYSKGKMLVAIIPDPVGELEKRIAMMTQRLNDMYVDEFSGDVDSVDLWLDARARRKNATEGRAGTYSDELGSKRNKHGRLISVPVSPVRKLKKDERVV